MNSLFKLTSALLLGASAFAAHAATQSVTVQYTLTVPTACTLAKAGTKVAKSLPANGTPVNETFSVTCNTDYTISANTKYPAGGVNTSYLRYTGPQGTTLITYPITLSSPLRNVPVNNAAGTKVTAGLSAAPEIYTLTASAPALTLSSLLAADYTDEVTIEIAY